MLWGDFWFWSLRLFDPRLNLIFLVALLLPRQGIPRARESRGEEPYGESSSFLLDGAERIILRLLLD